MKKPPHAAAASRRGGGLTRRQALRAAGLGLGLGPLASMSQGCGPMPTRCLGGPRAPEPASGGDEAAPLTPRQLLSGVDTIVVVLMENRSFDHFFGGLALDATTTMKMDCLAGAEANPDAGGTMVATGPLDGSGTLNPLHDWASSHVAFNGGRNDGFVRLNAGANQAEVMAYLGRAQLPFCYGLAQQSTICDRWFSSAMGPTWPNRFHVHATTSLGETKNRPMGLSGPSTVWERLADGCWTGKNYYAGAVPWYSVAFPAKSFSGNDPMVPETMDAFFRDAASGNLPHFALIDPDFQLNDGHPPHDLALAEAFVASVHRALVESPQWARTLLVVTFDEHGGFYDHVAPPTIADPFPAFRQMGFRVPAIVAGPLVRPGHVVSTTFDHASIAATLRARYGIASLGARMDAANDLSACIDPARVAAAASPAPPRLPPVQVSGALLRQGPRRGTSQPELERLARAGGVPADHVDTRAPLERMQGWLRRARDLEAVRVIE